MGFQWVRSLISLGDEVAEAAGLSKPGALGLTRFACQQPFEIEERDTEDQDKKPGQRRAVANENGTSLN